MKNIGIIGFGNMGEAFAAGLKSKFKDIRFGVVEKFAPRAKLARAQYGATDFTGKIKALLDFADLTIIAVKPQDAAAVLKDIAPYSTGKKFVAIVAGKTLDFYTSYLQTQYIARFMPSLAAMYQKAVVGVSFPSRDSDFTFEDIVLLDDRAIQKALRKIDVANLARALKPVGPEIRDRIFRNMSKRAAELLKEDMEYLGPLRKAEINIARQKVISVIQKLEASGEIIATGGPGPDFKGFRAEILELAAAAGSALEIPEKLMAMITGLSGSGIAFAFAFIHALAMGGVKTGLGYTQACDVAIQVVEGAAAVLRGTKDTPANLIAKVSSPAGTTIAGIEALEEAAFTAAVMRAVEQATSRAEELEGA
jgi:pyrroline-5-carboxylate reductase